MTPIEALDMLVDEAYAMADEGYGPSVQIGYDAIAKAEKVLRNALGLDARTFQGDK